MITDSASLDNLHDIVVPDPVSWWPLAPGWHVVILGILIVIFWISIRLMQQWQKNRFRREALSELETIKPSELPALVKRVALSVWPREQVASLTGDDWLRFLDQSGSTKNFTDGPGRILNAISYSPGNKLDSGSPEFSELKITIRSWIQNA